MKIHYRSIIISILAIVAPMHGNGTIKEFWTAVENNDLHAVRIHLNNNPDNINLRDEYNSTPLINAVINNHTDMAKLLLAYKADVNAQDVVGNTPLIFATEQEHVELVTMLLNAGANPNVQDYPAPSADNEPIEKINDFSALMYAVQKNTPSFKSIALLLLRHKANPNLQNKNGHTALSIAAMHHNSPMVKLLLKNNANPNILDNDSYNPLFLALRHYESSPSFGETKNIITLLIQHNIEVNHLEKNFQISAISIATENDLPELTKLLIAAKAVPGLRDSDGKSAIDVIPETSHHAAFFKELLENPAEYMEKHPQEFTPYLSLMRNTLIKKEFCRKRRASDAFSFIKQRELGKKSSKRELSIQ